MSEGEEGLLEERGRVYDLYCWHLALYVPLKLSADHEYAFLRSRWLAWKIDGIECILEKKI